MKISRRYPWSLWPDSICPSFLTDPALDHLQGDKYWKIEVEFEYTEENFSTMKDIFCIVPKYTGLSIYEKRIFIGIGYHDEDDWIGTDSFLEPNTVYNITYEHIPDKELLVKIDGEVGFKYDLTIRPLAVVDNPIVFIGINKHTTKEETEVPDLIMYNFKIYNDRGLICHHDFKNNIHGKSIDKTGNLNFLYQIG
jgi:hypothetical protein|tara:strand:- start:137 stop:721 length:585 start_codon:yes stop_codon:yes gene_type:complete